ncbi:hypothetical protein BJ742DRAFT_741360 [Cladochytrium replicatum]|nr:hypothetical protein BJ742DRAFT_741360 [Cladochytrium replicatum]
MPLHGRSAPPPQANAYSVAHIFPVHKWKALKQKGLKAPRLSETQGLSLFYHADEYLTKSVKLLQKCTDPNSERWRKYIERVHRAQRLLLDSVQLIYQDMDDSVKANRDYRRQLPPEDQRELEGGFSENILFAAQALSKGFRIRGIERFTSDLVDPARLLCATFETLRVVLRRRAMISAAPPLDDLAPIVKEFDIAWTAFERKICFCYFEIQYTGAPGKEDGTDMFQVLLSETILYSLKQGYFTLDQVESADPEVIIGLPRLALLAALTHMPECVNITDPKSGFRWFRTKAHKLADAQAVILHWSPERLRRFERMLAQCDDIDTSAKSEHDEEKRDSATVLDDGATDVGSSPLSFESFYMCTGNTHMRGSSVSTTMSALSVVTALSGTTVASPTSFSAPLLPSPTDSIPSKPDREMHRHYRLICAVADDLQSGPRAREFATVLGAVFSIHRC